MVFKLADSVNEGHVLPRPIELREGTREWSVARLVAVEARCPGRSNRGVSGERREAPRVRCTRG